jgi:hypothetical protein
MRLNICLEDPFGQKNHTAVKVPGRNSMVITDDYHTPILTRRKFVFVRQGEQSCFTGNFGGVIASKGESRVKAIVDGPASKATCFGSLLQLPSAKIGKVPLRVQFQIPCQPEPHL